MQCSSCSFQLPPGISICPRCGQKQTFTPVPLSPPSTNGTAAPYPSMPSQPQIPARPRYLSSMKLRPLSSSVSTWQSQSQVPARPFSTQELPPSSNTSIAPLQPRKPDYNSSMKESSLHPSNYIPESNAYIATDLPSALSNPVKPIPSFNSKLCHPMPQQQANTASLIGENASIPSSYASLASTRQDIIHRQQVSSTPKALVRSAVVTTTRGLSLSNKTRKLLFIIVSPLIAVLLLSLGGYAIFLSREQSLHMSTSGQTLHPVNTLPPILTTNPIDLYTQATSRKPIFTDSLQLQTANQWLPANTTGTCDLQEDGLHTFSSDGSTAVLCMAEATNFTNAAFQAQVSIVQGDTAGLIFRADSLAQKQYLLGITSSGVYMVALANEPSDLQVHVIAGGISSVINRGLNSPNQLTIIARNSTFYIYINHQFVSQVNDATYSFGAIGLFSADSDGNPTEAVFNNVRLWSI